MPLEQNEILNDRYRIDGQLGKGGMGTVYLAHDRTLDIHVAVKENLNLNPESERQFRREARLLASLRHPNLPRVTDHFILEDRQYLVMDYIAGTDLHTRSMEKPPSVEEVLDWADSVGDALAYLHIRQPPVIHRDIKPANLKLQPDGNVVLVDFGIAKESDQGITTTGARGLTPGFSPPEQYGDQRTDARSDQYALAATIYSLLTGQRPADSIKRMLGKEQLKPARELNPAIPEHVDAGLQRALALDKDQRFPSVVEFRKALRGELDMETVRASLPSLDGATIPARRSSNRAIWIGGIAAVVLVGGGLALALSGALPFLRSEPTSTPTHTAAVAVVLPTETIAPSPLPPEATQTATTAPTATAPASPTPAPITLGGASRIAFVSDREDGSTLQIWTMNPDGSDPRQLTFGPGDKSQPRWSPDGTRLLYVAPGGRDEFGNDFGLDIFVVNADRSGETINLTQSIGDDFDPAWSYDGSQIAFTSTRVNELRQVFLIGVSCEPAPQTCAVAQNPDNLTEGFAVEYQPAWAPDNNRLAVIASINQAPGRIFLRPVIREENKTGDPDEGQARMFDVRDRIIGAQELSWSSDGEFLVFSWIISRGREEIYIASLANPGLDPVQLTNSLGNKEPAFSPDGQWIAFTTTRDQNPEIYIMTNNGSGQKNLTNDPGRDLQPDWLPYSSP
ncbi:MAG: protein kinase [Anaerolineales bacterium]|nr:protein kinase [Anaerolineales bacterium]